MAIKYFCDKCDVEIPQEELISITKLWKAPKYKLDVQRLNAINKTDDIESEARTLCVKCADDVWKQTQKK